MSDTPELPPRPQPPRRWSDPLHAWLGWFGLGRLVLSAVCVVAVVGGVAWLVRSPAASTEAGLPFTATTGAPASAITTPTLAPPATSTSVPTAMSMSMSVHVAGAVSGPGVYELDPGSRVHDAIEAAGGPTSDADLDGLNLAVFVSDGQRVYVPVAGEIDPATVPAGGASDDSSRESIAGVGPAAPIDLNTASVEQLEMLPGVGPATATAIVDDRERHGPFASVGDLERVPGIGPAKLAAVVDLVTV